MPSDRGHVSNKGQSRLRSPSRRTASLICAAVLLALSAACGGGTKEPPRQHARPPEAVSLDSVQIGTERTRAILADPMTSPPVKKIASDGKVTFVEYESAVLAMMDCTERVGASFRPEDPQLTSRGLYLWGISWQHDKGDLSEAVGNCNLTELGVVELLWKEHLMPSEAEIQSAVRLLAECMRANGLEAWIPESSQPADFLKVHRDAFINSNTTVLAAYDSCAKGVSEQYGLDGLVQLVG